jgi:hypothetical protein
MYALMTQNQIRPHIVMMQDMKVSEVARSQGGFLYNYMKYGRDMLRWKVPDGHITWAEKRDNFIARHMVQYKANPTDRRLHALYAWAYDPNVSRM